MQQGGLPRGVKVPIRSRKNIRRVSDRLRIALGLRDPYIDIERLLEHRLDEMGLVYDIADHQELSGNEAVTVPERNEIIIRSDVYQALRRGEHRARFTVVHEIGHWFLHHGVGLASNPTAGRHQFFEDSEWQADCFAAEFLMPAGIVARGFFTGNAVSQEFGVSLEAAIIRLKVLRSEGLMPRM